MLIARLPNIPNLPQHHHERALALLRAPDVTPAHLLAHADNLALIAALMREIGHPKETPLIPAFRSLAWIMRDIANTLSAYEAAAQ